MILPIYSSPVAKQVPFDNSSNGFLATDVQAAIEESANYLTVTETTSTTPVNTTSGTDVLMTSMTVTPVAGTYLVLFNTDLNSNNAGAAISISYYVGGAQLAVSQRKVIPFDGGALSAAAARGMGCLQSRITVNGSQAIEVQWSTSGGTATAANRSLITVRTA